MAGFDGPFSERYEHCVDTFEYDYGEYIDQLNYAEIICREADNHHLVKGIGQYFFDKYGGRDHEGHSSRDMSRSNCFQKAKSLIISKKDPGILDSYHGDEGKFEAVREAVSCGYVWKFEVDEPWHPKLFFDDTRITTYLFQHETAVFYTGQPKHIFFTKEGKQDLKEAEGIDGEYRNPDSVLKMGELRAGNIQVKDGSKDRFKDTGKEKAIYLGFLDKAKNYPLRDQGAREGLYEGSIVLELEVPTDIIAVSGATSNNHGRIENLETSKGSYDSPREMAQDFSRDEEIVINWRYSLSLKHITGIWDYGQFDSVPHFISLQVFVNRLMKKFPERMPNSQHHKPLDRDHKQKLKQIEEEFKAFGELRQQGGALNRLKVQIQALRKASDRKLSFLSSMDEALSNIEDGSYSQRNRGLAENDYKREVENFDLDRIEGECLKVDNNLERLIKQVQNITDVSIHYDVKRLRASDLEKFENIVKTVDSEIAEARRSVLKRLQQEGDIQNIEKLKEKLEEETVSGLNNLWEIDYDKNRFLIYLIRQADLEYGEKILEDLKESGY